MALDVYEATQEGARTRYVRLDSKATKEMKDAGWRLKKLGPASTFVHPRDPSYKPPAKKASS